MGREAEGHIHSWCKQWGHTEDGKKHKLSWHVWFWPTMLKHRCCWSPWHDHAEIQASKLINKDRENLKCTIYSLSDLIILLKNSCSLNRIFSINSNGFWSACICSIFSDITHLQLRKLPLTGLQLSLSQLIAIPNTDIQAVSQTDICYKHLHFLLFLQTPLNSTTSQFISHISAVTVV